MLFYGSQEAVLPGVTCRNAMVRRKPFTAVLEWLSNQQLNKPSGASATTQQLKLLEM